MLTCLSWYRGDDYASEDGSNEQDHYKDTVLCVLIWKGEKEEIYIRKFERRKKYHYKARVNQILEKVKEILEHEFTIRIKIKTNFWDFASTLKYVNISNWIKIS